jgi:hypothetical protein
MNPSKLAEHPLVPPQAVNAFHTIRLLVGVYLGISLLSVAAIVAFRDDSGVVNSAVWIRGMIVAASALLTLSFVIRAGRGSRRAYLRLRIITAVMLVAIAVVVALPGTFPVWLKVEQMICGLLLAAVAVLANGRALRELFADE